MRDQMRPSKSHKAVTSGRGARDPGTRHGWRLDGYPVGRSRACRLRSRCGHVLILLFQFVDRPLNSIRLVDQALLLATKGGDRFVLRLRCFAQGSVMWGDFPRPELHQAIDLLLIDGDIAER